MLLGLLGASLLGDILAGKDVNRAGEGSILELVMAFFFDYSSFFHFSSTIFLRLFISSTILFFSLNNFSFDYSSF